MVVFRRGVGRKRLGEELRRVGRGDLERTREIVGLEVDDLVVPAACGVERKAVALFAVVGEPGVVVVPDERPGRIDDDRARFTGVEPEFAAEHSRRFREEERHIHRVAVRGRFIFHYRAGRDGERRSRSPVGEHSRRPDHALVVDGERYVAVPGGCLQRVNARSGERDGVVAGEVGDGRKVVLYLRVLAVDRAGVAYLLLIALVVRVRNIHDERRRSAGLEPVAVRRGLAGSRRDHERVRDRHGDRAPGFFVEPVEPLDEGKLALKGAFRLAVVPAFRGERVGLAGEGDLGGEPRRTRRGRDGGGERHRGELRQAVREGRTVLGENAVESAGFERDGLGSDGRKPRGDLGVGRFNGVRRARRFGERHRARVAADDGGGILRRLALVVLERLELHGKRLVPFVKGDEIGDELDGDRLRLVVAVGPFKDAVLGDVVLAGLCGACHSAVLDADHAVPRRAVHGDHDGRRILPRGDRGSRELDRADVRELPEKRVAAVSSRLVAVLHGEEVFGLRLRHRELAHGLHILGHDAILGVGYGERHIVAFDILERDVVIVAVGAGDREVVLGVVVPERAPGVFGFDVLEGERCGGVGNPPRPAGWGVVPGVEGVGVLDFDDRRLRARVHGDGRGRHRRLVAAHRGELDGLRAAHENRRAAGILHRL